MHRLAVFGNPIAHSRSPDIHAAFAAQSNVQLSYERILVPEGEFPQIAAAFFRDGGIGCNITVPCKRDAWQLVEETSRDAEIAEAVNTISLGGDGQLIGDNTDGAGFVADLTANLGWSVAKKRILILGAGGAVAGVLGNLLAEGPETIHLHNRTHATAQTLVDRFHSLGLTGPEQLLACSREQLLEGYDLVINGTSAALAGQSFELPVSIIADHSCCYDMVYGDKALVFLDWARQQGAQNLSDGLGMLVEQAALAFRIWFQEEVDTRPVIETLRG